MESNLHNLAEPDATLMELVSRYCNARLSPEDQSQLQQLLETDDAAQRLYGRYMLMHGELQWQFRNEQADADVDDVFAPSCIPEKSIAPPTLAGAFYRTLGNLASLEWPVAYLIAAVSVAIGIAIGALVHVSQPREYVGPHGPAHTPNPQSPAPGPASIVAHITGMVDCVWEDVGCVERSEPHHQTRLEMRQASAAANQKSEIRNQKSPVRLGDRLALHSGLLELTYDTGARVILQGPVTYEVESPSGGRLSLGKLTAKLEKKSEVRGQRSETSHPQSLTPSPFVITTPTAVVTDLGTEFGVEVGKSGDTTSHVFRGSVRVQRRSTDGTGADAGQVLHANESVRVEGPADHGTNVTVTTASAAGFLREMPKRAIQLLDLVDVVAGGNGYSGGRNRGIDPTSGRVTNGRLPSDEFHLFGDGTYHRVAELPLVDGVFIPTGGKQPVQVDSAGHTFSGWVDATANEMYGDIWAGGEVPAQPTVNLSTKLGNVDYATPEHGLIFLHANSGITFDLAAVRHANPGRKIVRFCAAMGNTEPNSESLGIAGADVWVLVDGQLRFRRREINGCSGVFSVTIPIAENDRFLTLTTTDGGSGIEWDWIVFGDPRLEMESQTPR